MDLKEVPEVESPTAKSEVRTEADEKLIREVRALEKRSTFSDAFFSAPRQRRLSKDF